MGFFFFFFGHNLKKKSHEGNTPPDVGCLRTNVTVCGKPGRVCTLLTIGWWSCWAT